MESEDELDLTDPPAGGKRLHWHELPKAVRDAIEEGVGSTVVEAKTQKGGFSPGVAARLKLQDGGRVFLKVVGSHPNSESPNLHRKEAEIAAALPPGTPTPRLLWTFDDGDWVGLVFEDLEGRMPATPWRREELDRVLAALTDLAFALTPSPIDAPSLRETLDELFSGWRMLAQTPSLHPSIDDWCRRNLSALIELESNWPDAAQGETLVHADIRADNLLITENQVFVVDWPHASIGAIWTDLLFMLPSVRMQGGPAPWDIFDSHPLAREADPDAVTSVITAFAGYFVHRGLLPDPPGLPTVRDFQRRQGVETLEWLRQRID